MMVKNIILDQPGHFSYGKSSVDGLLQTGEARVKVHSVGICGTDYHAFHGRQPFFTYPRVLGHELGVEILELHPEISHLKIGDRCAVEPYLYCGNCNACISGKTNCCETLKVMGVHVDGGMQEILVLPARQLHPSSLLNFSQLALVETLGIGYHAVQRSGLTNLDTVLVIGAGPIGLSVLEFCRAASRTVVMDIDQGRLDFCRQHGYANEAIKSGAAVIDIIRQAFSGGLPSLVFDATGNPSSMEAAFDYTGHGGKLVFVGLYPGELRFSDPHFHRKELTLLATRNSLPADFRSIIKSMEEGKLDTKKWITHQLEFNSFIPQFNNLLANPGKVIKAVVNLNN